MLGTTINREGIREDIDNRDYTYSPDRPVPSFDARLGRQQPTYDRYASAEVVNQRPVARQDMYAPYKIPPAKIYGIVLTRITSAAAL